MSKVIFTENAPAAIGPYSQAIAVGNLLFASGQIPINPKTGAVEAEDIKGQTKQVCDNIVAVLAEAGTSTQASLHAPVLQLRSFPRMFLLKLKRLQNSLKTQHYHRKE